MGKKMYSVIPHVMLGHYKRKFSAKINWIYVLMERWHYDNDLHQTRRPVILSQWFLKYEERNSLRKYLNNTNTKKNSVAVPRKFLGVSLPHISSKWGILTKHWSRCPILKSWKLPQISGSATVWTRKHKQTWTSLLYHTLRTNLLFV